MEGVPLLACMDLYSEMLYGVLFIYLRLFYFFKFNFV